MRVSCFYAGHVAYVGHSIRRRLEHKSNKQNFRPISTSATRLLISPRVVSGEMFSETWQIPCSLLRPWNGFLVLLKPVRSMVEVLKPATSERGQSAQCLVNSTINSSNRFSLAPLWRKLVIAILRVCSLSSSRIPSTQWQLFCQHASECKILDVWHNSCTFTEFRGVKLEANNGNLM